MRVTVPAVVAAVLLWRVVVPQYSAAVDALRSLESVSLVLVGSAVALEMASLLANTLVTATVLGRRGPRYATLLRIDLTNLGASHVTPGGAVVAAAVRYRLLVRAGVPQQEALTAAAIQATGSNVVLGAVFAVGLVLSLAAVGGNALYGSAVGGVVVLVMTSSAAVWLVAGHIDRAVAIVRAVVDRVGLVDARVAESFLRTIAARLAEFSSDPRRAVTAISWAVLNWLFDAAALWVVLCAFGFRLGLPGLLTVYGLGGVLALVPVTPGGLGIVESVMVPAFGALGVPLDTALLGVVGWRLLEFWIPIPVALLAWSSLRLGTLRHTRAGTTGASAPGEHPRRQQHFHHGGELEHGQACTGFWCGPPRRERVLEVLEGRVLRASRGGGRRREGRHLPGQPRGRPRGRPRQSGAPDG
ncbi:YbhN family protein [Kineococcus sp. NPDC059986]|uniref:lysylphosphatidylglycerol synthase transmembrane domain-containing protein n=1 Tax=Kineococcus sp. NPDC059986 TaxID=3155538 RepID=UPI003450DCA2